MTAPRKITKEILQQLDPVERIVADRFILSGRWVLVERGEGIS